MRTRNQFSVGVVMLLAAASAGCSAPAEGAEREPVPVRVQTVESRGNSGPLRYSGTLEPASRVDMAFRVGGYVELIAEVDGEGGKRAIDKGDFVKKGTVLARIRSTDYAQKVNAASAQLHQARADERLAALELERAQKLFAGKAITKAELDLKIAKSDSAKAQVEGALAQTDEAGISLGDTVLKAPMDGVVLSRAVEVGKLVSPGEPAITIADVKNVKAVFGAPQIQVEELRIGSPVEVYVGAESESKAPQKLLSARVTRIAPAADTNGRVFSIEAMLPNEDGMLRPGSVVSFRIRDGERSDDSVVVPLRAVTRAPGDPNGFAVFVLDGEGDRATARLREVSLGEIVGNSVTVESGLDKSQRVVTVGASLLTDGTPTVVIR